MKSRKIILLILMVVTMMLPIISVYAAPCNTCTTQNCGRCGYGCELSDDGTSCVENQAKTRKVSCGNITEVPKKLVELTSWAITLIQIAVPIILVIMGSIDLLKGVTAQKEDEIKKGQQILIKRLIVAAIIFFLIVVVKLLVSLIADATSRDNNGKTESENITECIDCFLSGPDKCN